MDLQTLSVDGHVRVIASGDLDLATAPAFHDAVLAELRSTDVQVDLRAVTFIDSTGLRALLLADRSAKEAGRSLSLRPSREVRRVVDLAGLEGHFDLVG